MKEDDYTKNQNEPEKFNDAGDGDTCMDCGRDREGCYCGIIPTK